MIVEVMLRRRPALEEAISSLNAEFVESFATLSGFWAANKSAADTLYDPGIGESATLNFGSALIDGLKGKVVYAARFAAYLDRDVAQSDDFMVIRMETEKVDYKEFCSNTLVHLIKIFLPYRVVVETDKSIRRADWKTICEESQNTGRDIDGRDSIFRIWPTNFFDDQLCRRSFGIGAEEVVHRVSTECERAEVMEGGAFLQVTSFPVVGDALNDMSARVMACLNV